MNKKSILMPHSCQKIGWCLLLLSLLVHIFKALLIHDFDVAWYLAKASHITFIISFFLICLSKEKVEDEMISALRLKAIGITTYVFFILFLILSLVLELKPGFLFSSLEDTLSAYLSEFFLILLPLFLFVLYYSLFKWMLCKTNKQQAL